MQSCTGVRAVRKDQRPALHWLTVPRSLAISAHQQVCVTKDPLTACAKCSVTSTCSTIEQVRRNLKLCGPAARLVQPDNTSTCRFQDAAATYPLAPCHSVAIDCSSRGALPVRQRCPEERDFVGPAMHPSHEHLHCMRPGPAPIRLCGLCCYHGTFVSGKHLMQRRICLEPRCLPRRCGRGLL
jgi:hypothetical protein